MDRLHEATRSRVDAAPADAEALQDQRPARHDRQAQGRRQGGRAEARRRTRGDGVLPTEADKVADRDPPARPAGRVAALRRVGRRGGHAPGRAARPPARSSSTATTCAASPRSSTTARPASGPTAWPSGRCLRTSSRRSARRWPPSRPSRTATSARPTRTGPTRIFTMVHARSEGGLRGDHRGDRRARPGIDRARPPGGALLDLRVQEDPSRSTSRRSTASGRTSRWPGPHCRVGALAYGAQRRALRARAAGARRRASNSPVRAMRAIGRDPLFIARAEGPHVWDADGNRYVDFLATWGPAILGHADPEVIVRRSRRAAAAAPPTARPTEREIVFAEAVLEAFPSVEQLRMTSLRQRGRDRARCAWPAPRPAAR